MISEDDLHKIVEYERGYLDRKHNMGYCGNTTEYHNGYYEIGIVDVEQQRSAEAATYKDAHCNHGWYT